MGKEFFHITSIQDLAFDNWQCLWQQCKAHLDAY